MDARVFVFKGFGAWGFWGFWAFKGFKGLWGFRVLRAFGSSFKVSGL